MTTQTSTERKKSEQEFVVRGFFKDAYETPQLETRNYISNNRFEAIYLARSDGLTLLVSVTPV